MSVNTAKTAILLPPLSFLRDAPFVTMFSGSVENKVLVTYPVSLYTRDSAGKMNWLGFLYAFLFTGKDRKRAAYITYPLCFNDNFKEEIYEKLLKETEELATAFKASRIIYEGYKDITGEILYPVSSIAFGNTINADFLDFIKSKHFIQESASPCYNIPSPLPRDTSCVYTLSDFHERRRRYLELCRLSDSFPQLFDLESLVLQPPGIMDRFYFQEEWVVFMKSENEKGCIRWFPQSLFGKGKKAKVARMLFCNATPEVISTALAETLTMIASSGATQIQLADIPACVPESALNVMGASKVCETVRMVKYIPE